MDYRQNDIKNKAVLVHDLAYWGMILAACVLFYVLNLWTSYKEDDMQFSLLSDAGLMDFLRSQYERFLDHNGRSADTFAALFCAYLGKPVFNVCNTLVFALMAHLISLLSTGRRSLLAVTMFVTYVGACYPVPGQTMLFVAGSCNYMWAITTSLLMIYLLQRHEGKRFGKGMTALLILIALVGGCFNEATSFGVFGGMVLYYLFNRKMPDRNAVIALLAYLVGIIIILASPRIWERAADGGIAMNMSLGELLSSRSHIFVEKSLRILTPIAAAIVGIIVLVWKGFGPIKRCVWSYILLCMAALMFVLGYLFDRAYAPIATVSLIILIMAVDDLLSHWHWGGWLRVGAIVFGILASVYLYADDLGVLHRLKTFEDDIDREITAAPRHAILHERHFKGYSRFITPLSYDSWNFFTREATYTAYYDKDNVQFVNDSIYDRYHSGRLLDGAVPMHLVSDRPEIADSVLAVPGPDYMLVVLNVDTLLPCPQLATYYLAEPGAGMTEEEKRFRSQHGVANDFEPHGFFPLYYQGQQMLVMPLIDENTSRIVLQLDYDDRLGEMTLSRGAAR